MKFLFAISMLALFVGARPVFPQTQVRGRAVTRTTSAKAGAPSPAAPSPTPSLPAPKDSTIPDVLATLDRQNITLENLNPTVVQEVSKLGENIAQAWREMLDVQINTMLLEIESKKRRITAQAIYDQEVAKRITEPTEAEITKLISDSHDQTNQSDPATVRTQAISYLRAEKEQRLSQELVNRLKQLTPVVFVTDVNTPNIKPTAVLATVGGQPITVAMLESRMKPVIYKLRYSAYEYVRDALNRTINDLLLLAEAKRRNVAPEEFIRSEVTDRVQNPTDAEVEKFYNENKSQINGDLSAVKYQIATYLKDKAGQDAEKALSDRLRKNSNLKILLTEPEAPVHVINTAGEPSRGDANAPVTVIEFTDFQCPACAAMQPVLEEVLPTYGNKVRFVVRNYPLQRHENARKAAEAADAANAQGKFFEYTALLFKRQSALDVPSLKKYATEVGLDRARFDAELDKGVYAADVRHDLDDGETVGVGSTPTIFINGIILNDLSPEGLRAAIDKALAKAGR